MSENQTQQQVSVSERVVEGASIFAATGTIAAEAKAVLVDPSVSNSLPYNTEIVAGLAVGNTLTVAADALSHRLRKSGHERPADLIERSRKAVTWVGAVAVQLALAGSEAGTHGDPRIGYVTGMFGTVIGMKTGNMVNRIRNDNEVSSRR